MIRIKRLVEEDRKQDAASTLSDTTVLENQVAHAKTVDEPTAIEPDQHGVRTIEAVTLSWSPTHLAVSFVSILLVYYVYSLQGQMTGNFIPFVTSSFASHSLIPTIQIAAATVNAVCKPPIAKIADVFGRTTCLTLMVILYAGGFAMMAASPNVTTYAASYVFTQVGSTGLYFVLEVVISDFTTLSSRAFMLALVNVPFLINIWIGSLLAQRLLDANAARWGMGMWAIIVPVALIPLLVILVLQTRRLKRENLYPVPKWRTVSFRTLLVELFHDMDMVGFLLSATGFSMFLLGLNLGSGNDGRDWARPRIACLIVTGFAFSVGFFVWEAKYARSPVVPLYILRERTVGAACLTGIILWVTFYIWNSYFYSFIMVVSGLDVTWTGRITSIYSLGSTVCGLVVGLLIHYTGRYRWFLLAGPPIYIIGQGLAILFRGRTDGGGIGQIVLSQVVIAIGGGLCTVGTQMAVFSVSSHQAMAGAFALLWVATSVGGAIGLSISGSLWRSRFLPLLEKSFPKEEAARIYGSVVEQMAYPLGSPERTAIIEAYQTNMKFLRKIFKLLRIFHAYLIVIVSIHLSFIAFVSFFCKDIRLKSVKQPVKGLVFG